MNVITLFRIIITLFACHIHWKIVFWLMLVRFRKDLSVCEMDLCSLSKSPVYLSLWRIKVLDGYKTDGKLSLQSHSSGENSPRLQTGTYFPQPSERLTSFGTMGEHWLPPNKLNTNSLAGLVYFYSNYIFLTYPHSPIISTFM